MLYLFLFYPKNRPRSGQTFVKDKSMKIYSDAEGMEEKSYCIKFDSKPQPHRGC
jgi:hypothetical protein